ncbi:hypothetical protein AA0498_1376 [Acidomonas methanolica]|uniref:HTH cro/C1-type domain-containing protein n=1 Tax=Acidomonas methanolica NBRC 104435 TaxID=1231351 RepID=A0A023D780_ACIMT|nr:hypothetical protein Amme_068_013 [Acidomonas methanolica NBRC 104435]GBQ51067.1 hypothetical protein AA0498_1376 [Acidomonas methanolica]GEK99340.1 hypothetical protein AME01nite_18390 [Acidomonas methanolica NBRC 104435]
MAFGGVHQMLREPLIQQSSYSEVIPEMQRKISYTQRKCPTPDQIRSVRERAGVNQTFAAAMVGTTPRTWRRWEAGVHRMPLATWALFNIQSSRTAPPTSGSAS